MFYRVSGLKYSKMPSQVNFLDDKYQSINMRMGLADAPKCVSFQVQ